MSALLFIMFAASSATFGKHSWPMLKVHKRMCTSLQGLTLCAHVVLRTTDAHMQELSLAQTRLRQTAADLASLADPRARLAALVSRGQSISGLPEADRRPENQVMGCTAQVWLTVRWAGDDAVAIAADSDSSVSKGLAAVLIQAFSGLSPSQIDQADIADLEALALGPALAAPSRTNAFRNMFCALQKRARALQGELPTFPSLLITAESLEPQGAFAEAQAQFLQPAMSQVDRLAALLRQKQVGVVAHFYMDPEVQGVLTSAMAQWPHIAIPGANPPPLSRCNVHALITSLASHSHCATEAASLHATLRSASRTPSVHDHWCARRERTASISPVYLAAHDRFERAASVQIRW